MAKGLREAVIGVLCILTLSGMVSVNRAKGHDDIKIAWTSKVM